MSDIRALVQATLEGSLLAIPVYSYWLRRQEVTPDPNPDEYVVYTITAGIPAIGADGGILTLESSVTLRYFCREGLIGTAAGQQLIEDRLSRIRGAFQTAGFDCPGGWQSVGDVDGISFETFVLGVSFQEVTE